MIEFMVQYINKSALVAEIERRKQDAINNCGGFKSIREHECASCIVGQYEEMEEILDTLEVKEEVDMDKELDKYTADNFWALEGNNESPYLVEKDDMLKVAKHFFELGARVNNLSQQPTEVL